MAVGLFEFPNGLLKARQPLVHGPSAQRRSNASQHLHLRARRGRRTISRHCLACLAPRCAVSRAVRPTRFVVLRVIFLLLRSSHRTGCGRWTHAPIIPIKAPPSTTGRRRYIVTGVACGAEAAASANRSTLSTKIGVA